LQDEKNMKAKQENIDDSFWRLIYIFPVFINCLMLFCFLCFIKEDSIMFNLSEGKEVEALVLIDKVYNASEDR